MGFQSFLAPTLISDKRFGIFFTYFFCLMSPIHDLTMLLRQNIITTVTLTSSGAKTFTIPNYFTEKV